MEKLLSEFLTGETVKAAGLTEQSTHMNPLISGIEYDSRKIKPGNMYFALRGLHTDGHIYINDAIARGASAVILEEEISLKKESIVYMRAVNSRYALSPVSAAFYGHPSHKMCVIGVTGTEGKSTTVFLIWQLLRLMGQKAGFFSTVQYSPGTDARWNPEHQTTPEANVVQRMLWEMTENSVKYAVVEASSHGLSQRTNRVGDVDFDIAVLTNITHEHLEFHGTWEQYRFDKANLFRALDMTGRHTVISGGQQPPFHRFGVINADDPSAAYFAEATKQKIVLFSPKGRPSDLSLQSINSGEHGNRYEVYDSCSKKVITITDLLPGAFNAANVMAALLTVSGVLDIPIGDISPKTTELKPVRGRMTRLEYGQPFEVVVDYAHTPSSFLAIFPPLRKRLDQNHNRIISVFGSAGERDIKKRREQGKIAAQYSDIIILSDEDPRGENPIDILEEIEQGCLDFSGSEVPQNRERQIFARNENLFLIPDRCAAIRKALSCARSGDLVLLLGKGHENSIIYKDYIMPFDEINETKKALEEMGFNNNPLNH